MKAILRATGSVLLLAFAIFGNNLTGQHIISGTLLAAQIDGVEYTPPRQIGVSVGYKF